MQNRDHIAPYTVQWHPRARDGDRPELDSMVAPSSALSTYFVIYRYNGRMDVRLSPDGSGPSRRNALVNQLGTPHQHRPDHDPSLTSNRHLFLLLISHTRDAKTEHHTMSLTSGGGPEMKRRNENRLCQSKNAKGLEHGCRFRFGEWKHVWLSNLERGFITRPLSVIRRRFSQSPTHCTDPRMTMITFLNGNGQPPVPDCLYT